MDDDVGAGTQHWDLDEPAPPPVAVPAERRRRARRRRSIAFASAGLGVAAVVLVWPSQDGAGVRAAQVGGSVPTSSAPTTSGVSPSSAALPGSAAGDRGRGGLPGEEHLTVTIRRVLGNRVTVRAGRGCTTYTVDAATDVRLDGTSVPLTAVQPGQVAVLHVYPAGSLTRVERLLATSGPAATARPTPASPTG